MRLLSLHRSLAKPHTHVHSENKTDTEVLASKLLQRKTVLPVYHPIKFQADSKRTALGRILASCNWILNLSPTYFKENSHAAHVLAKDNRRTNGI